MATPLPHPAEKTDRGLALRERGKAKLQPPSLWKVLLHNDDYTTQDFVVFVLKSVFRKPDPEAVAIMLNVHRKGREVVGIYPRDVAETRLAQTRRLAEQKEYPLLLTLESEEVEP